MALQITISPSEYYDEKKNEFILIEGKTIELEHSLVTLSKWEAKHHKVFINNKELTNEEMIDYIKCMVIGEAPENFEYALTTEVIDKITNYIADPMTATKFYKQNTKRTDERITSELIYYWMIAQNIPVQFENWHLNRLLTLIRLCGVKQEKPKKMSQNDILRQNAKINAARRAKLHSKG